jgi:pre-rRNA-processing protein IPI1
LVPHSSMLLLFTSAAQTHVFPEIQIDGLRFLDILLKHTPKIVMASWIEGNSSQGMRILDGYLGILNVANKMRGSQGKSVRSLQSVKN